MKSILLFLFSFSFSFSFFSFGQTWEWSRSSVGASSDNGYSVASDASGDVFITGYFNSSKIIFGSDTLTKNGSADVFIVKYDSLGSVLWAKNFGGTGGDLGWTVISDVSGNAIVTGSFFSPTMIIGTYTLTNAYNTGWYQDAFIAKYDSNGNVLWAKSGGGINTDAGEGLATDIFGNIYLTGYFDSKTITFGSTTLTNANQSSATADFFLIKYDSNGNIIWTKRAGGMDSDIGYAVASDGLGNIFVTGMFSSPSIAFGSTVINNTSATGNFADIFIVKYDSNGNVVWGKNAGGAGDDEGLNIVTDVVGNIYLTGDFFSSTINFGTYTLVKAGSFDAFLAKYNSSGNVLWAQNVKGKHWDQGKGLAIDPLGNVYFTGGFSDGGTDSISFNNYLLPFPQGGNDPMFLFKIDPNGSVLCASSLTNGGIIGGVGYNSVAVNSLGDVYIGGSFWDSTFIVGVDSLTLTGARDIFVAKYRCDNTSAVNELSNEEKIIVYPNPSDGVFNLQINKMENLQMKIYNVFGECIYQQICRTTNEQIDLSKQPNGIYFIKAEMKEGNYSAKIIKQ